jgi:hypothetical protein
MVLFAGEGLAEKLWVEAHPGAVRDVTYDLRHALVHLTCFPFLRRLEHPLAEVLVVRKLADDQVVDVERAVLVLPHAANARLQVRDRLLHRRLLLVRRLEALEQVHLECRSYL